MSFERIGGTRFARFSFASLDILALYALALLALVAPVSLRSRDRAFRIIFLLFWSI